jgi:hypothetical protein
MRRRYGVTALARLNDLWCATDTSNWRDLSRPRPARRWFEHRDTNGDAVLIGWIHRLLEVHQHSQLIDHCIPEQIQHALPRREEVVITQLETKSSLRIAVQPEDSLDVNEIRCASTEAAESLVNSQECYESLDLEYSHSSATFEELLRVVRSRNSWRSTSSRSRQNIAERRQIWERCRRVLPITECSDAESASWSDRTATVRSRGSPNRPRLTFRGVSLRRVHPCCRS